MREEFQHRSLRDRMFRNATMQVSTDPASCCTIALRRKLGASVNVSAASGCLVDMPSAADPIRHGAVDESPTPCCTARIQERARTADVDLLE